MADLAEREALTLVVQLATDNALAGQLPFAAVVVRDGTEVGRGVNTALADLDPSAHAEVTAIRDAAQRLGTLDLSGTIIYSSCEPCAICRLIAAASGISEIVYAAPKELVPPTIDSAPATTARLITAVTAVLPHIARPGTTDTDVTTPFTTLH
ncbi:hypothetical protein GCM10010435_91250 [Winogradskya consettensis]|uniref:CMP/dCMP-type deaminase domain-containing protein n=1 Tax=Winogradskya consettensis TaxID=113560 RepID=A0A919SKY6_9ACTN|nr:nucleoside deaminase [Actinoplanes consettensis]GIM73352.1 hypothetical protein Aco04nite_34820 [Actinoplanes consettensis]